VLRAQGVVASVSAKDVGVCDGEGMIEGKLDRRGESAAIFAGYSALYERGWFAVRTNDGLPYAGITPKKIELILHHAQELGFGVKEGRGREWEDNGLLLLRKGVDRSHARETRPLDGVPEKVNVMQGVCREKSRKC